MPDAIFDSSAVAKLYHHEKGSDEVQRLFIGGFIRGPQWRRNYISGLTIVEVQSVFMKKLRAGLVSRTAVQLLRDRFLGDIRERRFQVVALRARHFHEAERLIRTQGDTSAIRTLDALQLAVALDLRDLALIDAFVTADRALCSIANAVGLETINPEEDGFSSATSSPASR